MNLASVIAGAPFRAALRVLAVFVPVFAVAGWLLVQTATQTLTAELEEQLREETLLLGDIYRNGGRAALAESLRSLSRNTPVDDLSTGLFDEAGLNLAGPIALAPDFVGLSDANLSRLTYGAVDGEHLVLVSRYADATLVVGRSNQPVVLVQRRLTLGLVAVGVFLSGVVLLLGATASARSFRRLSQMDAALMAFSKGDHGVRLPVHARGDQFDRVSVEMNANLDRLERSIAAMRFTAAAVAHDLKTPLGHAQMAIDRAAEAALAGGDPGAGLADAGEAVATLNRVFDTMLRITQISAASAPLAAERVDLLAMAEEVVLLLGPLAEAAGQALEVRHAAPVPVRGDAAMVQQMLVNLVQNAVQHAGPGARICVAVTGAVLEVVDDGPGVPADQRDTVLDPFVRLDSARGGGGSGLGLALVRAVVERHGGQLELADAGPGLRVVVDLRAAAL